ncbi:MAG: Lrp/AsnC family transcriptional regulator, partial [Sphingomonadales bacterium]|nr:Lrp/AsnC family transcriptional regulator [Sphingomonadales bacterium]
MRNDASAPCSKSIKKLLPKPARLKSAFRQIERNNLTFKRNIRHFTQTLNETMGMGPMDATDQKLLSLLRENARASTSALARDLGLSRSTVQDRINRLEKRGIVAGYTVRLGEETE